MIRRGIIRGAIWAIIIPLLFLQSCSDDGLSDVDALTIDQQVRGEAATISLDWYGLYLDIEQDLVDFRPNPTARAMGYIGIAAYEAVLPGLPDYQSLESVLPQYVRAGINPYNTAYWSVEVEHAAYWEAVLNHVYKATFEHFLLGMSEEQKGRIIDLYQDYAADLQLELGQQAYDSAILHASTVATNVIAYALSDQAGSTQVLNVEPPGYEAPVGEGLWRPTAPDFTTACHPYWRQVRLLVTPQDAVTVQPHLPFSEEPESPFYQQALEVNTTVQNLDFEDRWIAEFWSDDLVGVTFSPPGRQLAIANQLVEQVDSDLEEAILVYLHLGLALNDASVICWGGKYEYNLERPVDYIRRLINPDFRPILGDAVGIEGLNPNFPAYPSGHAAFAGAGASVFNAFFSQVPSFTDRCHEGRTSFLSDPRTFRSFDDMAAENAFSRLPLGVHFRMDSDEGLRLGGAVGDIVTAIDLSRR